MGVEPRRFIGGNVYLRGVHELSVCEALWRLCEPGETAVDAGANIGVMTSVLSRRIGPAGRIVSFEAHPQIFRQLERNVSFWGSRRIDRFEQAVSSRAGKLRIREGEIFKMNEGTACVGGDSIGDSSGEVEAIRLDDALGESGCGVIKIDVEGHEHEALLGAGELLASGGVRDLVFESTWEYPGRAHSLLLAAGYRIFDLGASLCGLILSEPRSRADGAERKSDYVATKEPERAQRLMAPRGWQVLRQRGGRCES